MANIHINESICLREICDLADVGSYYVQYGCRKYDQ